MTEARRARVRALFDEAAELPTGERRAFLDAACPGDPSLRAEVEGLLAFDPDPTDGETDDAFLKSPLLRSPEPPTHPAGPPVTALPQRIGHYRILHLLGEGGMGAVYEAEQDNPRRTVALKVIRPGFASPSMLKRFQHESQILGRLHHPGIAQVHEAGLADDGQPFFVMEFIRGVPLDAYARHRAQTLPARLELLARVCDAVQHAHDQGVVHRDLKPANILVEESGQPKVLDFGVARATDADLLTGAGLTQTGQLLGTPNYMSPEQVTGDPAAIDHRADVYALGVILFELTAHRLPYRLENRPLAETARLILEEEPPQLGSIDPELRGDVETIVAKALEKDPARRYQAAADLAADLRRWLAHEPILARPPSALYHLRKFARRHRGLVGGVLATGLALILGLVGTILFAVAESRQRGQAEQNLQLAEQNAREANHAKSEALHQTYRVCMAAAGAALQKPDVADAARYLKAAPAALRGWEWRYSSNRLDDSAAVVPLPVGGQGFLIAAPDQLLIGVLTSTELRITDLDGGKPRTVPLGPEYMRRVSVAQTRRGLRVAVWVDSTAFDLLDETGRVLCRVVRPDDKDSGPVSVAISPDGTRLACQTGDRYLLAVFDATSGKQTALCRGHDERVWGSYTFSPDSTRLATCSSDRTARVWNAATGELLTTCRGHAGAVTSVNFSPDGARLLTASTDGRVGQWDARTGHPVEPLYDHHGALLNSAVYSPDGQWVASAGEDRLIRVWRARGRQDLAVLQGHTERVNEVAFDPGGRRLASRSCRFGETDGWDGTVRVWDVDPSSSLPVLRGHFGAVQAVAYSPDGRWLASASWDKTVRLWDAATGEPCATLPHPSMVFGLAFGPDGTWLLTGDRYSGQLRVWDVATGRGKAFPIHEKDALFCQLKVSPDGTRVAATMEDPQFGNHRWTVVDLATKKPLVPIKGEAFGYSPDGRWLAVREPDEKTMRLLDARTYETSARFSGHESSVTAVAFSPDSRLLATGSKDHTVRLWQIGSGECRVLPGHTDVVYAVAFHPDGTRLASAARDGEIWLWDVVRSEEVARLPGHGGFVMTLAFSPPDGATLASGSGDGTIRLWDTAPLKTRYQARRAAAGLRPEAERLVDRLWSEKNDPAQVVKALQADQALGETLQHAAVRAVLRRPQPPAAASAKPPDPP